MRASIFGIIFSIVIIGTLGGLSNAYSLSFEWDQGMYMIEHSGILYLNLDDDFTEDITALVGVEGSSEDPIEVLLTRDGPNKFSSQFVKFTEDASGTNQLLIEGAGNARFIATVTDPVSATALSEVTQDNPTSLSNANFNYKEHKLTFSVDTEFDCVGFGDDTDGDGLCDEWENDSSIGLVVSLPDSEEPYIWPCDETLTYENDPLGTQVCPDPEKADLYFEIDYMEGHKPNKVGLGQVVQAFAWSNYKTPEGVKGINLHIIVDEKLPHVDKIPSPGSKNNPGSDQFKRFWYGTFEERNFAHVDDDAIWEGEKRDLRNYAFHYVVFAHDRLGAPGTSGYAEFPGNDAMISLGSWDGKVGSPDTQAGTLLHEIGHNLGRDHGGSDEVNCKPNYISVMSFSRQTSDIVDRQVQLSQRTLNPLNEEFTGNQTIGNYNKVVEVVYSNNTGLPFYTVTSNLPYNFGTPQDLNYFPGVGCDEQQLEVLNSARDYTDPKFVALEHGNWKDGRSMPNEERTAGENSMDSTITNVQLYSPQIPGDVCVNLNSNEYGVKPNPAIDRICISDELTIDHSISMRTSFIDVIEKEISLVPNAHFINPREAHDYKNFYKKQISLIKSHIIELNMPSAIEETQKFQSWFDGKGENEFIENTKSRDKIYDLSTKVIEAQMTAIPEFETIAIAVLSISIISVIILTGKTKLSLSRINQ